MLLTFTNSITFSTFSQCSPLVFCITIWVFSVFQKPVNFIITFFAIHYQHQVLYCLNIQFLTGRSKQMSLSKEKATTCSDFLQECNDNFLLKQFVSYQYNGSFCRFFSIIKSMFEKPFGNCFCNIFLSFSRNRLAQLDVGLQTLDVGLQTLDAELWTLNAGHWVLGSGCWTLDSGCWTLDAGRWTVDIGRWTLGFGHWALLLTVLEQNQKPVSDSA